MATNSKTVIKAISFIFLATLFARCVNAKHLVLKYNQKNGQVKEGRWISLDSNDRIIKVYRFKNNKLNGICIDFNSNGLIKRTAKYKDGKISGEVKLYDDFGRIVGKAIYKNDSLISSKSCNYY